MRVAGRPVFSACVMRKECSKLPELLTQCGRVSVAYNAASACPVAHDAHSWPAERLAALPPGVWTTVVQEEACRTNKTL